ncbi:MAG: exopolysaccharide biosynthesis protein [Oleiphilaceae bacterium]|nr:exopolysaccharide biosynthesis protein [Oleiphilaceae bacterium]
MTASRNEPDNMEKLLDRIERASEGQNLVSIDEIMDSVGRRSFGPVLMFVGIILVTPLSGVPGMPTTMGLLVLLTLGQRIIGRQHIWLPVWLVGRRIPRSKLVRGFSLVRPAARVLDSLTGPRATILLKGPGLDLMALTCVIIAVFMPATELVPFSSSILGFALMLFGLAMMAKDGIVALLAWGLVISVPLLIFAFG